MKNDDTRGQDGAEHGRLVLSQTPESGRGLPRDCSFKGDAILTPRRLNESLARAPKTTSARCAYRSMMPYGAGAFTATGRSGIGRRRIGGAARGSQAQTSTRPGGSEISLYTLSSMETTLVFCEKGEDDE